MWLSPVDLALSKILFCTHFLSIVSNNIPEQHVPSAFSAIKDLRGFSQSFQNESEVGILRQNRIMSFPVLTYY
jgi:hypothetical protein